MATQNTLSKAKVSIETGSKNLGTASIKAKNSSHIVQVLVNTMYANKEASSVREILSNAIDAHNMSNNKKDKVEIQIPTKTFPMLRIRDFGSGLSPEYMMNEYLSLGHSEKRDRNDAVGFMGLGRFALFSLFKSYFVTSFYEGKKYPYSIHLDERGDIAIDLMEDEVEETDEPNGLEVFVLVDSELRMDHFKKEILKLTFFCKDKVDLVNYDEDEIPSWYNISAIYEFGNIKVYDKSNNRELCNAFSVNDYHTGIIGVYDNIPYTLNSDFATPQIQTLLSSFNGSSLITVNLPIGSVERTASREGLERDKNNKTLKSLDDIAKESNKYINDFKTAFVSGVKNFDELSNSATKFFKHFDTNQVLKWTSPKGIVHSVNYSGFVSEIFRNELVRYNVDKRSGRMKKTDSTVNQWRSIKFDLTNTIFVELDSDEREEIWKSRIKNHLVSNNNISSVYTFVNKSESIQEFLDEIKATKVSSLAKPEKKTNDKDKSVLCFHSISENYSGINNYTLDSINASPEYFKDAIVVYFTCKQRNLVDIPKIFNIRNGVRELLRFTRTHGGNITVKENGKDKTIPKIFFCGLSERNVSTIKKNKNFYTWDKFVKCLPKLIPLEEKHFNSGIKQFFVGNQTITKNWYDIANIPSLEDTWLKKNVKELQKYQAKISKISSQTVHSEILSLYKDNASKDFSKIEDIFTAVKIRMENYPLLSTIYNFTGMIDEVALYMNAKYNLIKEENNTNGSAKKK